MRSESGVRRVKLALPGRVEDSGQRSQSLVGGGKYQGAVLGADNDQGGDGWESVEEERAVGADGPQN